ncbi:MAG: elongation factor P maturation arginine rhamnosyltransferase EarP [Lautropia sp.]
MDAAPRWDLYCRVVDNLGDAGILWRLARQLAVDEGCSVRLMIDDPGALAVMLPGACHGARIDAVEIRPFDATPAPPPDVIVCGFHAEAPAAARAPVRINYEYLSAEPWIDEFHGSPSPRADGRLEHYFYPGFTEASGGLPLERDLLSRRDAFQSDPTAGRRFLAALGVDLAPRERPLSVFVYPCSPIDRLLGEASRLPESLGRVHLVVPATDVAGERARWRARLADAGLDRPPDGGATVRVSVVPMLPQSDFDLLLWSCELNLVRGEDSWIRALWAARPFLWQAYPQADETRRAKVDAFLARLAPAGVGAGVGTDLGDGANALPDPLQCLCEWHRTWNGLPASAFAPDRGGPGLLETILARPDPIRARLLAWSGELGRRRAAPRLVAFADAIARRTL